MRTSKQYPHRLFKFNLLMHRQRVFFRKCFEHLSVNLCFRQISRKQNKGKLRFAFVGPLTKQEKSTT